MGAKKEHMDTCQDEAKNEMRRKIKSGSLENWRSYSGRGNSNQHLFLSIFEGKRASKDFQSCPSISSMGSQPKHIPMIKAVYWLHLQYNY
jgi:hypothetical protein